MENSSTIPLSIWIMNLSNRQASLSLSLLALSLFASCFHPSNASDKMSSYVSYGDWLNDTGYSNTALSFYQYRKIIESRYSTQNISSLSVGSATYSGDVDGTLATEDETYNYTGILSLNANFDSDTIKGTVDQVHNSEGSLDWEISLEETEINSRSAIFHGDLVLELEDNEYNGTWEGWFRNFSSNQTEAPNGVIGKVALVEEDIKLSGVFEGSKDQASTD